MSDSIASELLQKWVSAVKGGDPKQVTNLYHGMMGFCWEPFPTRKGLGMI